MGTVDHDKSSLEVVCILFFSMTGKVSDEQEAARGDGHRKYRKHNFQQVQ